MGSPVTAGNPDAPDGALPLDPVLVRRDPADPGLGHRLAGRATRRRSRRAEPGVLLAIALGGALGTPARYGIALLADDLPMAIVIVDAEERIRAFLDDLDDLITEGLVIVEDVEVVKYVGWPRS
jgi:uncharacterized protein